MISDTLIKDLCTGHHSIYITDANNCVGTVQWGGTWQEFVDSGVVVVNNNINGKISNNVIGAFKIVKKYGNKKFTSKFLKKEISSSIPKMIVKQKNIILIFRNLYKKLFIIYF